MQHLCGFENLLTPANLDVDAHDPLGDMDQMWIILTACLVFLMQPGFALLEVGSVGPNISHNIVMKNLFDAAMSCLVFYLVGWGFAYGDDAGGFIGTTDFAVVDSKAYSMYMFQATFAGAATTIVSGALAGRVKLEAYFIYTFFISAFTYPIVVHWVWGSGGFLNGFEENDFGIIDFAGSGVVHMVGGFTGLVGAIYLGPRISVMEGTNVAHSVPFTVVGTFILWFGWYGFNCGSTLMAQQGAMDLAGLVAMTTTLSASTGCVTATVISFIADGRTSASYSCNGLLGALVAITANCCVVEGWHAIIIGFIAAIVYAASSKALKHLKIDDPVDASCVHGFCGLWGVLASGIFATDDAIENAGYSAALVERSVGERFGKQLLACLIILAWSCGLGTAVFFAIDKVIGLRVDEETERHGLDIVEHGAPAWNLSQAPSLKGSNNEEEAMQLNSPVIEDVPVMDIQHVEIDYEKEAELEDNGEKIQLQQIP